LEQARLYRGLRPAIDLDTGMQRFGCRADEVPELLAAADTAEVLTHAVDLPAVQRLIDACAGLNVRRHAASSSLLDQPQAWLEGVRPGLALYRGALRVTTRLMLVRETRGPVGYTGFTAERVGVLPVGYACGLTAGAVVLIGGRRQRVLEAGMNTSFVSADATDRGGDEVTLMGEGMDEFVQAAVLSIRLQEVLCRFAGMGERI
jgi:alanine racemase